MRCTVTVADAGLPDTSASSPTNDPPCKCVIVRPRDSTSTCPSHIKTSSFTGSPSRVTSAPGSSDRQLPTLTSCAKGALAEQMQLLHVPQTMLIGDQADYLIQVDNFEK